MHKTGIAGDVHRPGRCGLLAVPLTDLVSLARCSARPLSLDTTVALFRRRRLWSIPARAGIGQQNGRLEWAAWR